MIWKQKRWVVLIWAAVSVAGAAFVLRLRPTFRAETLILVDSQKIPDKYVATTVVSDVQDRLATLSQEILSTTRLKKIIDDYNLYPEERKSRAMEEIVELMRRDVDVKLEKGWTGNRPGAFRIGYQGPTAQVVAQVANRLASLYIDENLKNRELLAEGTSEFMAAQLNDAKKTLDDMESAVSRYKMEHNGELPQQENGINTVLARLQTQLQGAQDAINRAQQSKTLIEAELSSAESTLAALQKLSSASSADAGSPASAATASGTTPEPPKRSQVLEAQLAALRTRYSGEHPDMKRMALELARLKAEEAEAPAEAPVAAKSADGARPPRKSAATGEASREIDQLRQRINGMKAQSALADKEIQERTAERSRLVSEMGSYQAQLRRLPLREQEMAGLTRDYEIAKANYRTLLDKKISADMATEMERRQKAERFTVLDPAVVPEKPAKPNRPVLIGLSCAVGLGLGLIVALGKEWNKNVLLGEWELPAGVPIVGRIPVIVMPAAGGARPKKRSRNKTHALIGATLLLLTFVVSVSAGWRPF
jgi:polysaccharide chain length determinant protein (PEP-CTERM system associated)